MITREIAQATHPTKPLGEVAAFLDHKRRPVKQSERKDGLFPYYGANGLQGTIDGFIFDEPLILLAEDGGHFDDPDRGIAYEISGKTWVNNHAHVLKPRTTDLDLTYLRRVLENYDVRPFINGSTRSKLTKAQAERIPIPLPPLHEQRRIAVILNRADALRRKGQCALDLLDTLSQSIFLEMFGDPESNPKCWKRGRIGDLLVETQYGTSDKAGEVGKFPILRMGNITYKGGTDLKDLKYIDLSDKDVEKFTVRRGDILFNRTNSADLVGKTAVFNGDELFAFAGYLVRARVRGDVSPHYVSSYLNSTHGKATLRGMAKSIVGMANINAKEMQSIPILIPDAHTQHQYSCILSSIEASRALCSRQLSLLDSVFASLQSRAFSGQL